MADYTITNLREVEDAAAKRGQQGLEARFARRALEAENSGLTYFRLDPGFRVPFGHAHSEQEEIYLPISGGGRIKLGDEVVEVREWDAVRIAPGVWRSVEAGPEGMVMLAYGAGPSGDTEMAPGWWSD